MGIPTNIVIMWSGAIIDIPSGWQLCDGTNGTPDLRNRFVVGAGEDYSVGNTGGFADSILLSHNHSVSLDSIGNHGHSASGTGGLGGATPNLVDMNRSPSNYTFGASTTAAGTHSHTITINNEGTSATNANLPPYYALAFIQQIE